MDKDLIKWGLDGQHTNCDEKKDTHYCGFGSTIEKFISQDSANKLDSREQLIDGKEMKVALGTMTLDVLKKSEWKRLRKRLGKQLSILGQASIQVDIIDGQPFVSLGKLISYTKIAGELKEVILDAEYVIEHLEQGYPVYERFFIEDGTIKKMFGIKVDGEWIIDGDIVSYPSTVTRIPVKIFANNEDEVSDINNTNMWWAINQLNNFTDKIEDTQLKSQFGLLVNRNMTGGKTAAELMNELREKGTITVNGIDSQLGAGVNPIGSVGYVTELAFLIDWLEDKVMKYTFTTRDTTASGTNKHNAEIGMFNQFAIEYLMDKKEIREEDYADFYNILGMFTGDSVETVELQISQVLQNMLDAMNPETPNVQENINVDETTEGE